MMLTSRRFVRLAVSLSLVAAPVASAMAQGALTAGPSGRGSTTVALSAPRVQGQPAAKPLKISIDYGQPHARGRVVAGALADDLGKVWRLGANEATTLTTEVDLDIGGSRIPAGTYTLFAETTKGAWKLIVNKKTGEWGTQYDQAMDLVRIPLKERTLSSPVESFTMWLVPTQGAAAGELRFAWGTLEHSVAWAVAK